MKRLASEAPVLLPPPLQRQDKKRGAHLRVVARQAPPPPRPQPRLAVRISVSDERAPYGRTLPLWLSEADVADLIAIAVRMQGRLA